jgi:copper chaperone CopZ
MWGRHRAATPSQQPTASRAAVGATARITIPVFGLTCGGGGALTAERALARVPGVVRAYVNPATEMAYVQFDPAVCGEEKLLEALRDHGFSNATHG